MFEFRIVWVGRVEWRHLAVAALIAVTGLHSSGVPLPLLK